MIRYDRSIKIAFDKTSGEILIADEVFDIKTDAFEIRKTYHKKNLSLSCCECDQDLIVSGSKHDRLHFKHKPGHNYCILADGRLTPLEHERFTKILKSKESDRHKELKNKIGVQLKSVKGVDLNSIAIDNKFIIKPNGKRRPDVYCKFQNREIVFEIQLSDLSLGYILSRYEFYKEHGIYLIWILDNFDIHNQGTLERDIKYLTKYHNFFKLDEQSETIKLECEYKYPFLTDDNRLLYKWLKKSISLQELKYDNKEFQGYYYNFGDNKTKKETHQRVKLKILLIQLQISEKEKFKISKQ
jgi:competence CoiA-like predicted nuclease